MTLKAVYSEKKEKEMMWKLYFCTDFAFMFKKQFIFYVTNTRRKQIKKEQIKNPVKQPVCYESVLYIL